MSGICGSIHFNGAPVEPKILNQMATAAAYRGPAGIHHWCSTNIGLTYLALHVTPESLSEKQPLESQDDALILVADARVDNRTELIAILAAQGLLPKTKPTDADLILAAYQQWGVESPAYIIGDFAFAIWDAKQQHLFAARDPLAMRPFYYRSEPGRLLFASEIKQILAAPHVPKQICETMVGLFLAVDGGPEALTFYEGIRQLPAGHALIVTCEDERSWRYWDVEPEVTIRYKKEEEYFDHFREIFVEAVRCRLRSINPIGLFLSGGMDSSSVGATAGWLYQQEPAAGYPAFQTYSYAFNELIECDERHVSEHIVRAYNLPAIPIPAEAAWPLKDYPQHGPDRDEPLMGAYQTLINYALATAKAAGVGIMMTGGYGDHMVGGSRLYYQDLLRNLAWRTLSADLCRQAKRTGESVVDLHKRYLLRPLPSLLWPSGRADRLRQGLRRLLQRTQPPPVALPRWIEPNFATRIKLQTLMAPSPVMHINGLARQQRYGWFNAFEMRLETWTERNYATYGLCHADPWSDRRIMSFVFAIPPRVLGRAGEYKRMAAHGLRGILPEEVRRNAGKTYPSPLYRRAMTLHARDTVLCLLTDPVAAQFGYIDGAALQSHYASILKGEEEDNGFWPALLVEMWLRQHWI